MTHSESRRILDENHAAIKANTEAYFAREIDHATFSARQKQYHDAIQSAGRQDQFLRRWRREAYA